MAERIKSRRLSSGALVALQRRGTKYDVIRNSTGIAWHYVKKAVSEQQAAAEFDRLVLSDFMDAPAARVSLDAIL